MQERRRRILRIGLTSLFVTLVLSGASGAAALYIGSETLLGRSALAVNGVECRTVATTRMKDPDGLWIRQFIVTDPVDEQVRLRTALRIAESMRKAETARLIQVSVLDGSGPVKVSGLRGRAIGAQVTLIPNPVSDVDKQAGELSGFSMQGTAGSDGEFHGLRLDAMPEDLVAMAGAFDDVVGCTIEQAAASART